MGFLDNVSQKLTQVTQTTVQKTKDFTDTAQLNRAVTETEKARQEAFAALGEQYFALFGSCAAPELQTLCGNIRALNDKLQSLQADIEAIKATAYCPSCGTKLADDPVFCTNCGHKLKQE